jgi:hypothetical protein
MTQARAAGAGRIFAVTAAARAAGESRDGAAPRGCERPQQRRLFDQALAPPLQARRHPRRQTAPCRGRGVVVELENAVAPIALIGLVADGEVEGFQAAFDGIGQQLAQMQGARSVMGDFAVHVAGEQVIVATAEHDAEIGGRAHVADLRAPDVHQMTRLGIGGEVEEKRAMSGQREDVGHAFAGERAALLLHEDVERAARVDAIGSGDELNVAELRHVSELRAVAAARRR